jgi:hypothetical protein
MKIKIEWLTDQYDCEDCGFSWAGGANVYFDDEFVIGMQPSAACYDGASYSDADVYDAILQKLGHTVEHE